jgi:hypothetical protein
VGEQVPSLDELKSAALSPYIDGEVFEEFPGESSSRLLL